MTETMHEEQTYSQEMQDATAVVNMINGTAPNGNTIGEVAASSDEGYARINNDSRPQNDYHVADAKVRIPQGTYESTIAEHYNEASASVSREGYRHTFSDKNANRAAQIITGKAVDIIAPSAVAEAKKKVDTLNEQIERLS